MNFIDPSDFQNLASDLLAMFFINHEKMALTKSGNMSIKSLLACIMDSFLTAYKRNQINIEYIL